MNTTKLDKIIKTLPKNRQRKIKARAVQLIQTEMSMQEIRKTTNITQEELALKLGIGQDNISRIENRLDIKLSTLNNYIKALGGKLRIVIEMPGDQKINLLLSK